MQMMLLIFELGLRSPPQRKTFFATLEGLASSQQTQHHRTRRSAHPILPGGAA
jgi:hypothetical protein